MSRRSSTSVVLALAAAAGSILVTTPLQVTASPASFHPRPGSVAFGTPSAYPSVVAAGDGSYHAVARVDGFGQHIQHRVSENAGISWHTTVTLRSPDGGATRPRVAADGDVVAITFIGGYCSAPNICGTAPFLAVSEDGGYKFNGPVRLGTDAFDVAVGVSGDAVWVAWERGSSIEVRATEDAGRTFPVARTVAVAGYGPDVSAAGRTVVIAWNTFDGPQALIGRNGALGSVQPLAGQGTFLPVQGATAVEAKGTGHVVLNTPEGVSTRSVQAGDTDFAAPVKVFTGRARGTISARDGLVAVGIAATDGTAYVSTSVNHGQDFSAAVPVATMPGSTSGDLFADVTVAKRATDRPLARFDWSVPDRYVKGGGGRRPSATSVGSGLLDVELDACNSLPPDGATISEYVWTVDGNDLADTDCSATIQVADGATATVRVEVVASNGSRNSIESDVEPVDHLVVSIGDSIASGEGNPHTDGAWHPAFVSPTWEDRACHRSDMAGAARAAAALEDADSRSSVTFIDLACSGASILDTPDAAGTAPSPPDDPETGGLLDPYEGIEPWLDPPRPPQIDQMVAAVGGAEVDALLVSIGANDIRFSEVVKECIVSSPLDPRPCNRSATATNVAARLATLPARYDQLASRLDQVGIHPGSVFIAEYFDPTVSDLGLPDLKCIAESEEVGDLAGDLAEAAAFVSSAAPQPVVQKIATAVEYGAGVVSALLDGGLVTDDETAWARANVVAPLNAAVQSAATAHGWHYVGGIATKFDGHGYCASDPWVVGLGESVNRQHDVDGAFHPNAAGHRAIGKAIEGAVTRQLDGGLTPDAFPSKVSLGDVYVTVSDRDRVWASIVRDTGGVPDLTDIREMDRLSLGDGYMGPGTPAADEASAVTAWWEVSADGGALPTAMIGQITLAENVGVRSVAVVQAPVDGKLLVADRASVVLATIDARIAGPQTIDVTTEVTAEDPGGGIRTVVDLVTQQVKLVPGRNDVLLPVDDTFTIAEGERAVASVTVSEAIGPGGDPTDNVRASAEDRIPTAKVTRSLSVIALPADVGGTDVGCAAAGRTARRMIDYASDAIPTGSIDGALACNALPISGSSEQAQLEALATLDHLARLTAQDAVVAVVPGGWLQSFAGGAVGISVPSLRAVIVEATAPPETLAHELAHTLGILHKAQVPAEGARVATRTAPRGIDWMNPVVVPKVWTGGATWDTMFELIGGPELAPHLPNPAHPGVWVRGTVEQLPDGEWVVGPAQWTPSDPDSPPPDDDQLDELELERMTVDQRDSGGDLLDETEVPFRPSGGLYGAAVGELPDPTGGLFATEIEIHPDAAVLQLVQGGVVLDERAVGAAPTVTVDAPAAGATVSRGGTMTVAWTLADPDSTVLTADVLVSADGGTWKPLALGIDATLGTVELAVPADLDGSDVRVRVVVSDGVRSGQDDSDPFTVDGGGAATAERVVFSRDATGEGDAEGAGLYTMNPDGTDVQAVNLPTEHGYDFGNSSFEPVHWRTPHLGADGRLYMAGNLVRPEWDPQTGAFPPARLTGLTAIFSSLPDGSDLRKISRFGGRPASNFTPTTRCPETSPDGTKLAWRGYPPDPVSEEFDASHESILVANTDGSAQRIVLQSGQTIPASALNSTWFAPEGPITVFAISCPRWSPDGTRIAVLSDVNYRYTFPGRAFPANIHSQAVPMVIDLASGDVQVLADLPRYGTRFFGDGGTSFDPFDFWDELDWIDNATLYSQLYESSGLCGFPFTCTWTYTRMLVDAATGGMTRVAEMTPAVPGDGVKVSPIDGALIYGGVNEYNPIGASGRDFAVHDLALDTTDVFPLAPEFSLDVEFDWGFVAQGGGQATEPVVLPPPDPVPAVTTGGPYHAVQFEPIVLDAGSSSGLTGDTLVEWDLDGDGAFGGPADAVGVRPTVVFPEVGTRSIRVRIVSGDATTTSEASEVVVTPAPPNEALPPAPGADGPVPPVVTPTDISVTVPAGTATVVALQPTGARFAVVDDSAAAGLLGIAAPAGAGVPGEPVTTGSDGLLLVTPVDGFLGTATLLVANPLAPDATATVTVEVVGNAPPIAVDDTRSVTAGQVTTFAVDELLTNDSDPDGPTDELRVVAVRAATNGEAYVDTAGTVFVSPTAVGSGQAEVVIADGEGAIATSQLLLEVIAAPPPPGAPTGLIATPGDGQVTLGWQEPASSEPITEYQVEMRAPGGDWTTTSGSAQRALRFAAAAVADVPTTALVSGLANGVTYEFRVAARSSLGLGAYSAVASATPGAAPSPTTDPPPATTDPAITNPPSSTTTTVVATPPPTINPRSQLPSTGSGVAGWLVTASAVVMAGAFVIGVSRRRRAS